MRPLIVGPAAILRLKLPALARAPTIRLSNNQNCYSGGNPRNLDSTTSVPIVKAKIARRGLKIIIKYNTL